MSSMIFFKFRLTVYENLLVARIYYFIYYYMHDFYYLNNFNINIAFILFLFDLIIVFFLNGNVNNNVVEIK